MRATGSGARLTPVERALERVEQHVADLARVDQLVEAERARRAVRRLELGAAQALGLVDVGAGRAAHRRGAHRAHRRARQREHRRLPVEADHAHHHRAEAVGLAQRHLELRARARASAPRTCARRCAGCRASPTRCPASRPGCRRGRPAADGTSPRR